MNPERNIKLARIIEYPVIWTHENLRACAEKPENRETNGGRGIYLKCWACDLHGYANEVDWSGDCPNPYIPDFDTDPAIWTHLMTLNRLGVLPLYSTKEWRVIPSIPRLGLVIVEKTPGAAVMSWVLEVGEHGERVKHPEWMEG